jgi:hypothetical protein
VLTSSVKRTLDDRGLSEVSPVSAAGSGPILSTRERKREVGSLSIGPEHGERLFDIPVYRLPPERWIQEQEDVADEIHCDWREAGVRAPGLMERARSIVYGGIPPFAYNEIIGWICVVWDAPGPVIKAYYSQIKGVQIRRKWNRRRPMVWRGKLFELWFTNGDSNSSIGNEIRNNVLAATEPEAPFARRWVDLQPYDSLAAAIPWRSLIRLDHD